LVLTLDASLLKELIIIIIIILLSNILSSMESSSVDILSFYRRALYSGAYKSFDSDRLTHDIARFFAAISLAELARLAKLVDELMWEDGWSSFPDLVLVFKIHKRYH
jgi:hypothetical protein